MQQKLNNGDKKQKRLNKNTSLEIFRKNFDIVTPET